MKSISRTSIAFFALSMLVCGPTFAQTKKLCVTVVERGYASIGLDTYANTNWFHVHCGRGNTWGQALANAKKHINYGAEDGWDYIGTGLPVPGLYRDGGEAKGLSAADAIRDCTAGFRYFKNYPYRQGPSAFYNRCYD